MGRFNSSKTRVAPVFNALLTRDPTGQTWLPRLVMLGSRSSSIAGISDVGALPGDHPAWWGRNERGFRPPVALLRWLVRNASEPASLRAWGAETTRRRRKLLVRRDPKTVQQALELLDGKIPRRAWYVLEGESRPDACLQTDRILLVAEGKRTEPKGTT